MIDNLTKAAYERFPEGRHKPLIGMTGNHSDIDITLRDVYHQQIVRAGGVPVLIPPVDDIEVVIETLEHLDGLVLTGGADYDPAWCGEERSPLLGNINEVRDAPELMITRLAYNRNIPMLGICRGIQTLATALGGHVAQDISEAKNRDSEFKTQDSLLIHSQTEDRPVKTHSITVIEGTKLAEILREQLSIVHSPLSTSVNSFHHQSVDETGDKFRVSAVAPDGIIEAMESAEERSIIGVQWHPECLGDDGLPLFQWLVDEATLYNKAKQIHSKAVTLDSHCDTPMFFPQGVNFLRRDDKIKVDLHKMTDGRLDTCFMVAYIPQPKEGLSFSETLGQPFDSPKQYADSIFDKIEGFVKEKPDYLAIARTPQDILAKKRLGKKSIVLGIENGLGIEDSLDNLRHFADRGIAYMTLCHNGDNAICDSARRSNNIHGGVSEFGEKVIREMNRLGIMVDLSHGGEKSFYDALEISQTPIVCSHSNGKALCDSPRNLTDDQMRAMAKKGGVCQITFYPGFLKDNGEANILDGLAHLHHAIDIMGIDHVGIGTDFDGDGGVPGMDDASDALHFTMHLLRQRYSEEDIMKIWGQNWLRVWHECLVSS